MDEMDDRPVWRGSLVDALNRRLGNGYARGLERGPGKVLCPTCGGAFGLPAPAEHGESVLECTACGRGYYAKVVVGGAGGLSGLAIVLTAMSSNEGGAVMAVVRVCERCWEPIAGQGEDEARFCLACDPRMGGVRFEVEGEEDSP